MPQQILGETVHVMIDIETLGNANDAAILSIGAIAFFPSSPSHGDIPEHKSFHKHVTLKSNLETGRTITASTLQWWLRQSPIAQQRVFLPDTAVTLNRALEELHEFITGVAGELILFTSTGVYIQSKDLNVWANSPSFDLAILETAFQGAGLKVPWEYYQERDVRTIKTLLTSEELGLIKYRNKSRVEHDALEDCRYQVDIVLEAFKGILQRHEQIQREKNSAYV